MKIERIVFPTDFSEESERALPHALEIARRFDARISLLHVRTPYGDDPRRPEFRFFDERKYEEYVEQCLADLLDGIETQELVETVLVKDVAAASGVLDYADQSEADLIVMGTHGRSGLAHFLLGSVAEKVVRHATCSVLTVASLRKPYRSATDYKKVLIAFDFSDTSRDAVRRGKDFASRFGSEVAVLYVLEQSVFPPFDTTWKASVKQDLKEVEASARKALAATLDSDESLEGIHLEVIAGDADGKAEAEIVEYASRHEVDLIIMGTHGLSGLNHALLGSTTERVVRTADCPVLTFHKRD
ncbi:MAG: universal stress protein [Acidobacteriota bacterium]|nr:MAG: universal stress protein [Acidobacteriota bacterium]